ncbi:MAG: lysophospholipid acyltransferase family protein [Candidatus Krumholzibacteriota bacterium]|nr:lysophospholipid acyltransferase family protein [Candidatus Krumholzibacteriota bacterium]
MRKREEKPIKAWKKIKHRLELAGVYFMLALPALLPLKLAVKMGGWLGVLAFDLFRIRRRVSLDNLRRAFGDRYGERERIKIARRSYVNFAKSMVEFASVRSISREKLRKLVALRGREQVDEVLSRGKGALIVTGHFGSWEFLGAAAVAHGMPASFLVGDQSNRLVDDLMNKIRAHAGIGLISRGVGARGIFTALKNNRMVAMLSDQDARKAGIFVDFFGIPSSTYPGAAQFAYRAGTPIIFCYIVRNKDESHEVFFLPPLEVNQDAAKQEEILRLTAAHVQALEECVTRYPDHYFWPHRRWKTIPPADL